LTTTAAMRTAMSIAGGLLIAGSVAGIDHTRHFPGRWALLPVSGAALIIASGPDSWFNRLLSLRAVVGIGLISYPLYLWHWPLLVFLRLLNWGQALGVNNIWASRGLKILTLVAAAGLAAGTYHAIERRVRRASERDGAMFGVAALCAAVACGVAVTGSKGMPWRLEHPERVAALAWPDTLQLHPACVERYGEPFTGRDRFCATNAPPDRHHDVLLLGDSHANALWPGVSAANPGMATMLGATGCPPLRDIHVWLEGEGWNRDKCPEIMRRAFDVVADTVDMVVLASRMPEYLSGRGYGEAEEGGRALMAEGAAGDARPRHAMLRDDFARDLRWLARRARRVVVVLPLPELGFAMDECVGGRPIARMLGTGRHRCEVPRADVERRQAGARRLIGEAVVTAGAANVAVVDPMDVLCDATSCSAVRDGLVLYRDDDHLSVEGARYVWSRLAASAPRTVD
jgi:hypothetical protein